MIVVENKDKKLVMFNTLLKGDVFLWEEMVMMKVAMLNSVNVVVLKGASLRYFRGDEMVEPVKGAVTWSRL